MFQKIKALCIKLWNRPSADTCPQWDAAEEWFRGINVPAELCFDLAFDEAKRRYPETVEESDKKDSKAQWVFGVSLSSTAAAIAVTGSWELPIKLIVPTIALLFLSMVFAVRTITPARRPTPMTIRDAMRMEQNEPNPRAILTASYYVAIEGMNAVNQWKSLNLKFSVGLLMLAACSFVIPASHRAEPVGKPSRDSLRESPPAVAGYIQDQAAARSAGPSWEGDSAAIRRMAPILADWFPQS